MEHLTLKAATAVQTDEGTFTAVISTVAVDRHKDIVDPDGLVRALHKWVGVGKNIPLAWHHSTRPEDIIGHIDPATSRNEGGQVVVEGWIDEGVEPAGKNAWRLVKSGTLGFSYGFIPLAQEPRKGGGFHIKEADVFEITATPIPANHETRVVGWKSADALVEEHGKATEEFLDATIEATPSPEPEPTPETPLSKAIERLKAGDSRQWTADDVMGLFNGIEDDGKVLRVVSADEQRILDNATKSVETGKEHWPSVDPLVQEAMATSLEHAKKSSDIPQTTAPVEVKQGPSLDEFQREHYELMLTYLRGPNEERI